VGLRPGQLIIGIVFIPQTWTATLVVGKFEVKVTAAAAAVKLQTGPDVCGDLLARHIVSFVLLVLRANAMQPY